MKEKNLREVLEKCSKAELVKVVLKASELTYTTFPWLKMIGEIRLEEIDANLDESKKLSCKFNEIYQNPHRHTDNDALKIRIALARNHKEWKQLNSKHDKISKELYG